TVVFNGVTGTGSATAEGLVKDTEYTIDVSYEGQTYKYYLTIKERQAFSANRVWAVMPAPGQFVNEHSQTTTGTLGAQGWGDGWDTTLYGATPEQAGRSNYAQPGYSLGWFGGFITYEFDEPIQNSDKNKYGVDFTVYGNAFYGNSEPAGVMVSQDGETWYALAGSKHYDADTVWNYEVTYLNPNPDFSPYESSNVPYTDNQGGGGTYISNGYHPQPNYPVADNYLFEGNYAADIYDSAELTLSGTMIKGAGSWGYADVHPNSTSDFDKPGNPYRYASDGLRYDEGGAYGDGFDISWAVDENGMPVKLDSVKYVKIYNASIGVAVGEVSPEITAITRTTGEAASVGTTEAPVITVNGKALELEDGVYTYEVPMSGTIEVTAALDGGYVWINNDQDGTYNEENVVSGRIVRVLAQKGESQPVIYYLTMVSSVAGDEDVAEVEELIAAIGEVTLAKENQINAARAAYNALPAALQSQVSNYAVLTAAEARLQELKGGSGGPVVDNTINVSFRLIGAELAEDDVDLGTVVYRPNYVTWVATTAYEMDKGSTVYDLFVEAMNDAGLTQVGAENNYVATIYAPSGYELSEFTNGNRSGWMYTINGSHPGFGLRQQTLRDGDVVVWHYVNDYAWEVEDWSAIGGGQWPQESTSEKNYWNGWLMAPDRVGGKGGALPISGSDVPDSPSDKDEEEKVDPDTGFTDVKDTDYYYDAVKWAVEKGITNGTSDTTFSPAASCTRAQMVTFLWRAAGEPKAKSTTCVFTDVDKDAYYYEALLWAIENGITNGTSDTTFSPDAVCNRGQMATFLYRSAKTPSVSGSHDFTDVKADAYYNDAVIWAADQKITNGTSDTTFSPDADCTRGQMVTFLYRYLAK
ncbi:MAG: S-layer homology domain-containing protein, partial [Eubacteriales bacterium]|nr:S-layer homology domain-containing protein [Eubacteriales bacterium]